MWAAERLVGREIVLVGSGIAPPIATSLDNQPRLAVVTTVRSEVQIGAVSAS